jgi:hypothetical protein
MSKVTSKVPSKKLSQKEAKMLRVKQQKSEIITIEQKQTPQIEFIKLSVVISIAEAYTSAEADTSAESYTSAMYLSPFKQSSV